MSINQSTITRRKQKILKGLRIKLHDRDESQRFLHKDSLSLQSNDCVTAARDSTVNGFRTPCCKEPKQRGQLTIGSISKQGDYYG